MGRMNLPPSIFKYLMKTRKVKNSLSLEWGYLRKILPVCGQKAYPAMFFSEGLPELVNPIGPKR